MFWVISVYFNIRNILPKSGTFLLGHPVYIYIYIYICTTPVKLKNSAFCNTLHLFNLTLTVNSDFFFININNQMVRIMKTKGVLCEIECDVLFVI